MIIIQIEIIVFFLLFILLLISFNKSNQYENININEMKYVFSDIYKYHKWIRGSGRGSDNECCIEYRVFLKEIFYKYNVQTIIDYGCGDWKMLNTFIFNDSQTYIGYDIVKSVIEENKKKYSKRNVKFYQIHNSLNDLLDGDIIMIKDVFQHWNNENILKFVNVVLPNYKYSLITNTYNYSEKNKNIEIGKCRSLDLEKPPFNMKFIIKRDMYFCGELKRIYLLKRNILNYFHFM